MLDKIYKALVPLLLFTIVALMIQINILPTRITKDVMTTLNLSTTVTDTVTIKVADKLIHKNKMVYFKGKTIDMPYSINDKFKYNPEYPREFWDGYLTLAKINDGGLYFIWTKTKSNEQKEFDGWYITLSDTWQNKKDYLSVLIPVVERN